MEHILSSHRLQKGGRGACLIDFHYFGQKFYVSFLMLSDHPGVLLDADDVTDSFDVQGPGA